MAWSYCCFGVPAGSVGWTAGAAAGWSDDRPVTVPSVWGGASGAGLIRGLRVATDAGGGEVTPGAGSAEAVAPAVPAGSSARSLRSTSETSFENRESNCPTACCSSSAPPVSLRISVSS